MNECSVIGCKETSTHKDDITYYGLHLKLGLCNKHTEQSIKTVLYEVEKMDKPNKCPIATWEAKETEDEKENRILIPEKDMCLFPWWFLHKAGAGANVITPACFRCPSCYSDGGDYTNCDFFSKWWWHKFGNGKKIGKKSNGRNPISKSLRHEVFKRDNYACVECGVTKEERTLHIDHKLPVSQGGTDELDNLQTLCEKCNLSKSNRKW